MWRKWADLTTFELWHQQVIEALNLPRISVNAATGNPQPEAQQTTGYTTIFQVAADDWRAYVETHVAQEFPNELGEESTPPPDDLQWLPA